MKPTSKDKDELISRCKELYKNNHSQLLIINEFQETYTSDQVVWWYTRDTFLYRLLNKALRIQNIDLLFAFQFFISDLQKQLELDQCSQAMKIYRAQLMSKDEIQELQNSIGEYISINSFFSTSQDKKYAIFLLGDTKSIRDDLQRVLFEIDADPSHAGIKPFADISSKSYFPNECEILIMSGAIFRLNGIILNEENIWIINLTLSSDQDEELKSRIDQIKGEYNNQEINLFSFGKILHKMNKYDDAAKYYRRLLTEFSNDYKQTGLCCYHLGRVHSAKGNYEDSMKWYKKSLEIMMETMDAVDSNIAECFNSIGNIYRKQEDYKQALDAYQKALDIWEHALVDGHSKIDKCLINMGVVYHAMEDYNKALECHEKALKIKQECQEINHSDVAVLYNNIGIVHECLDQFDLALKHFEQALEIYRTSSDLQNIEYGITLENIGHLYENNEKWRQALIYFEEAVTVYRYTLSPTHPRIIQIEKDIGNVSSLIRN
jgi:tetratricopeptide (TPR) repeat protein